MFWATDFWKAGFWADNFWIGLNQGGGTSGPVPPFFRIGPFPRTK